jgi:hypothetical protein
MHYELEDLNQRSDSQSLLATDLHGTHKSMF